jgi:peptide/nickel transport system substrate-binding protein
LPEAYAPFLDHVTFPVLPAHMFSGVRSADLKLHPANLSPVGSGPFQVENLGLADKESPAEITLTTNPFYHGDTPMLSAIKIKYYLDEYSAIEALRQNEVMGVGGLSQGGIASILNNDNFNIHSSLLPETKMILLNQQNESLKFFREKKVRLALLLGLNRKFFVNEFLSGQAVLASSPIPPGNWAFNDSLMNVYYDPDNAADLLSESGWALPESDVEGINDNSGLQKDGQELKFQLLVPNDDLSVVLGEIAVEDWGRLGINAVLQTVESDILKEEHLDTREFQAIMIDVSLQRTPDPDPYPFWHQTEIESGQNYSGYDNRIISEYLEQARTTPSISARSSLYHMFQKRFVDDTPALLVYHPVYSYVTNKVVNGVQMGPIIEPSDRFNGIADWYIVIRRVVGRLTN